MELVTTVTLMLVAFFFAYIAFQLPRDNKPMRIFFLMLAMMMVYLSVGALYTGGLAPEPRLNSTSEVSGYFNCTFNGTVNSTCVSTNITYTYGNYTKAWFYDPAQGALSITQWAIMFVLFYFIVFFFISIIEFLVVEVFHKYKPGG